MPQQANFLNYMQQTGALKGYDPVQSEERATNIMGARTNILAAQAGIESQELTSEMKRLEIGKSALRQVQNKEDYQGYRRFMVDKIGLSPDIFPENFSTGVSDAADDIKFEEWKKETLLTADQLIKAKQGKPFTIHKTNSDGTKINIKVNSVDQLKRWKEEGLIDDTYKLGQISGAKKSDKPLKTWVTPDGEILNLPNTKAPPKGSVPYSTGFDIEVGKEGTTIRTGIGRKGKQTKKTTGAIEAKALAAVEGISRLNEIAATYKPEYLQLDTKLKTLKTKWQEIGEGTHIGAILGTASPEDQQLLSDFSDFKRNSIGNINLYIKEITGAQMSEKEADRIRLGMPDPGEGFF